MSESSLIPVEQRTVVFYDDEITAVVVENDQGRTVYVPVRILCDHLGLSYSGQRERIGRDPVLSDVVRFVRVTRTNSDGGNPNVLALPLDYLNGWLFGVSANRVNPDIREKLIAYQRECYQVLARHFTAVSAAPSSASSTLMQVREMGLAIVRMAEEQMEFDRRLAGTETAVSDLGVRVQALEEKLSPPEHAVTDAQASQISQAVKAVAVVLGKQTKRNEFGGVYGELYRKFDVTSYKLIPAAKFEAVMAWLNEWYQSLTNQDLPF
ncbi:MAG: ORF6C domain-containing protein [Chloroflexi bacterium]|nr:ORF6C domain-containing protein [Chloroflexota bacterium]